MKQNQSISILEEEKLVYSVLNIGHGPEFPVLEPINE